MGNTKDLHDISAFYFFVLAFAYVIAALAFRNDYMGAYAILFMRVFDIPLALVSLIYGGTSLHLQLSENETRPDAPWNLVILITCIALFGLAVFINFAFPSVI